MHKKKIAVIGGGPAGLGTIKCLLEENIEPVCFEKTQYYGGLWRYHDDDTEGIASVMKTTIINTSKEMSALSDFPPPEHFPNYMHNTEVYQMLTEYAKKFDLLNYITYNKEVCKVEQADDYLETGRIKVKVKDSCTGEISEDTYDGAAVCIGHHVYPNMPTFPGQEKFKGRILHTHSLKTVEDYVDQVVVVVGVGNSGMDAAVEISSTARQVYLSTRRGTWVVPRVGPSGIPFDMAVTSHFTKKLFELLPYNTACSLFESMLNKNFDHAKYNLKPKHRVFSQHPSVSDGIPIKLLSGTVKVKKDIKEFVEDGVIFEGDDIPMKVDAVVLATGYLIKFPFIDEKLTTVKKNKVHLYKYIYPPHLKHPSLGIIGLIQSVGAGFPIGEAQGRLFCQVFNGQVKLPNQEDMEEDIAAKNKELAERYVNTDRHTIQVDYVDYLDEINAMFGAKPNFIKMFITDPKLWNVLFFGPSLPYQYRLVGPHSWPGARKAILECKSRMYKHLNKNYKPRPKNYQRVLLKTLYLLCMMLIVNSILNRIISYVI